MMALVQHKKILDQEMPLLKKCMELAPENPESEEDHLSEISLGHYEYEKDWTEPTYWKALFLYERRNKKASLLSHLRDVKARRYPHQSSIFNKELSEAREKWTKEQKEGDAMLKIAKMEVDFKRKGKFGVPSSPRRKKKMGRTKGVVGQAKRRGIRREKKELG